MLQLVIVASKRVDYHQGHSLRPPLHQTGRAVARQLSGLPEQYSAVRRPDAVCEPSMTFPPASRRALHVSRWPSLLSCRDEQCEAMLVGNLDMRFGCDKELTGLLFVKEGRYGVHPLTSASEWSAPASSSARIASRASFSIAQCSAVQRLAFNRALFSAPCLQSMRSRLKRAPQSTHK